jgi:hypothetical protein
LCRRPPRKKSDSGGKGTAKEKVMRFFDLLEATKERHQLARLLDKDEQRRSLEEEVVKLVVFAQKMEFNESKRQVIYIPYTVC